MCEGDGVISCGAEIVNGEDTRTFVSPDQTLLRPFTAFFFNDDVFIFHANFLGGGPSSPGLEIRVGTACVKVDSSTTVESLTLEFGESVTGPSDERLGSKHIGWARSFLKRVDWTEEMEAAVGEWDLWCPDLNKLNPVEEDDFE